MNLIKILKILFDNSSNRQERETANPTCHEAMSVQKNKQLSTNIITKKQQWLLSLALWELFPLTFSTLSFSSPLFLLYFPSFSSLTSPSYFFFFLLSFFDLVTRDVQLNVDVNLRRSWLVIINIIMSGLHLSLTAEVRPIYTKNYNFKHK